MIASPVTVQLQSREPQNKSEVLKGKARSIVPENAGTLYVVATPIGNLDDMSPRGRQVLDSVDVILCEDTRHTGRLTSAFGIATKRLSLHEHNETKRVPEVISGLRSGRNYALVSDAGTPLVSDPGFRLLAAARAGQLKVSPVPGPSAVTAALSVCGLASDRFVFEGFLPSRKVARRSRLDALAGESRTMVLFESARRIGVVLHDCATVFTGARPAAIGREMTKAFETVYRDDLDGLIKRHASDPDMSRGELVLVIAGAEDRAQQKTTLGVEKVVRLLLQEMPVSKAASLAAKLTDATKREAYDLAIRLKDGR
jgi:16S rRNA (cytidine1402-2'-O)-methyltransferase